MRYWLFPILCARYTQCSPNKQYDMHFAGGHATLPALIALGKENSKLSLYV